MNSLTANAARTQPQDSQLAHTPTQFISAPFTPLLHSVKAAIEIAGRRLRDESWFRGPVVERAIRLYLELEQRERARRKEPDHTAGTLEARGLDIRRDLGWSAMTHWRALKLLRLAGVLTVRRIGGWSNYQPHCVGSCHTFHTQLGRNHHSPLYIHKKRARERAPIPLRNYIEGCRHAPTCRSSYQCSRLQAIEAAMTDATITPAEGLRLHAMVARGS